MTSFIDSTHDKSFSVYKQLDSFSNPAPIDSIADSRQLNSFLALAPVDIDINLPASSSVFP